MAREETQATTEDTHCFVERFDAFEYGFCLELCPSRPRRSSRNFTQLVLLTAGAEVTGPLGGNLTVWHSIMLMTHTVCGQILTSRHFLPTGVDLGSFTGAASEASLCVSIVSVQCFQKQIQLVFLFDQSFPKPRREMKFIRMPSLNVRSFDSPSGPLDPPESQAKSPTAILTTSPTRVKICIA